MASGRARGRICRRAGRPHRRLHAFFRRRSGRGDVLVAVATDGLGQALKWEPSRGGALFPHLYGTLPLTAVRWTKPLPLGPDGRHVFPSLDRD
jgi:uncharacterized protein (DUF952 family)